MESARGRAKKIIYDAEGLPPAADAAEQTTWSISPRTRLAVPLTVAALLLLAVVALLTRMAQRSDGLGEGRAVYTAARVCLLENCKAPIDLYKAASMAGETVLPPGEDGLFADAESAAGQLHAAGTLPDGSALPENPLCLREPDGDEITLFCWVNARGRYVIRDETGAWQVTRRAPDWYLGERGALIPVGTA